MRRKASIVAVAVVACMLLAACLYKPTVNLYILDNVDVKARIRAETYPTTQAIDHYGVYE